MFGYLGDFFLVELLLEVLVGEVGVNCLDFLVCVLGFVVGYDVVEGFLDEDFGLRFVVVGDSGDELFLPVFFFGFEDFDRVFLDLFVLEAEDFPVDAETEE